MLVAFILRLLGAMFLLGALHLNHNTTGIKLRKQLFALLYWLFLADCVFLLIVWFLLGENYFYLDWNIPINQAYGPLTYFLYLESRDGQVSRTSYISHGTPVLIVWAAYLAFVSSGVFTGDFYQYYTAAIYFCICISMLGYSVYVLRHSAKRMNTRSQTIFISWYLFIAGLAGAFLTLQVLTGGANLQNIAERNSNEVLTSLFMLGGAISLFGEALSDFRHQFIPKFAMSRPENRIKKEEKQAAQKTLDIHSSKEGKEMAYFFSSEYITDPGMNSKKASELLKISQKELKDRMEKYYGTSFSKLLTQKRIELAGRLLQNKKFEEYNDLALRCGFSSKATFYRNFQKINGCSPSQYKTQRPEEDSPLSLY